MSIPDYQTVMLPLLKLTADGKEHQIQESAMILAGEFKLTEGELKEMLPSGGTGIFFSRVGWARTYLKKAGLLCNPKRSRFQITERGLAVLGQNLKKIDVKFLKQFPEFLEFQSPKKTAAGDVVIEPLEESSKTPEDMIASGYTKLRKSLESDLLARVKSCPPDFFERLVVRLVTKMGYGGSLADAGKAIGKSGDGELMASSRRISLASTSFTSKPNAGKTRLLGVQRFRNLLAPSTDARQKREYSLQLQHFRRRLGNMLMAWRAESY
jgi:restriction system protein